MTFEDELKKLMGELKVMVDYLPDCRAKDNIRRKVGAIEQHLRREGDFW